MAKAPAVTRIVVFGRSQRNVTSQVLGSRYGPATAASSHHIAVKWVTPSSSNRTASRGASLKRKSTLSPVRPAATRFARDAPNQRRSIMTALRKSLQTLASIAAIGGLVAASPLPASAQGNPCAPRARKASNPCRAKAKRAANPVPPRRQIPAPRKLRTPAHPDEKIRPALHVENSAPFASPPQRWSKAARRRLPCLERVGEL